MHQTIELYLHQSYGINAAISQCPTGNFKVEFGNGHSKTFSCNIFGDIIDCEEKRIIAVGNTHHDIDNTYELPTKWYPVSTPNEADQIMALPKSRIDVLINRRTFTERKKNSR